jgi:hypothetical protein
LRVRAIDRCHLCALNAVSTRTIASSNRPHRSQKAATAAAVGSATSSKPRSLTCTDRGARDERFASLFEMLIFLMAGVSTAAMSQAPASSSAQGYANFPAAGYGGMHYGQTSSLPAQQFFSQFAGRPPYTDFGGTNFNSARNMQPGRHPERHNFPPMHDCGDWIAGGGRRGGHSAQTSSDWHFGGRGGGFVNLRGRGRGFSGPFSGGPPQVLLIILLAYLVKKYTF